MREGHVDFEWAGVFSGPTRDLRLRAVSSSSNGVWVFIERDGASGNR